MKYLTKEWYERCQRTDLYFGLRVHSGAESYSDALYKRLYKRKEKEFVDLERDIYDVDPRFMLEQDGSTFVSLDACINEEDISEEDQMIYQMYLEEKEHIQQLIEEYESRPPFNEGQCREKFRLSQESEIRETINRLPHNIYQQIADVRVFCLGYCTKDVLRQLKDLSKENEKTMNRVLKDYYKAQEEELIPDVIKDHFDFHDCKMIKVAVSETDMVMHLDTSGGFTHFNKVTFTAPEIIKQEGPINGKIWLYEELYRTEVGYEVHILFSSDGLSELIIRCTDIRIEEI